jgi:NADH-quinone oxidoreductase subunit G
MEPVTITIDGGEIRTAQGKTVIEAALEAGIAIPHYCYHPRLSIAGNCRMCLVEIEKMPKLQIACNTRVSEGMTVHTANAKVEAAKKAVMEFLLINHPLDCPICDQAGECRLQEYYMQHDLRDSRFAERKERDRKREIFGPFVVFDGERCVKCTRCVRFCQEITKTEELTMIHRGDHETVSLFPGAVLDNPLSVNVVDICPVGALTDRDFRFKKRVWFLKKTPSVCPGCSTGCNISVETSENRIYRFKPRVNEGVNSHWICDEGRYSFHRLTEGERITCPFVREGGNLIPATYDAAVSQAAKGMREAGFGAAILSGRSTNEEAFLFSRLVKAAFGFKRVEVAYEERPLTPVEAILKSPDRSPNFQGARHMGVVSEDGTPDGYESLLEGLRRREFETLFVVGEDPAGTHPELREPLLHVPFLVVQDSQWSETARIAQVVLPGTNFAEKNGTYTNRRLRVQRVSRALEPPPGAQEDWRIFRDLLIACGFEIRVDSSGEIFSKIREDFPAYRNLTLESIGALGTPLETG